VIRANPLRSFLGGGGEVWKLVLGSKQKGKSSGKHQFQWLDEPWVRIAIVVM
jgi:hypothetical protein